MFNCHKHLSAFYCARVALTEVMKDEMRRRRRANQDRLAKGLEEADEPKPLRHVKQGSYAMHAMVQAEYDASDIDDGVVFSDDDLVGPRGGEYSPSEAKHIVRDAVDDDWFKQKPDVRTNCVRVYYNDGFTIDIPIYKEVEKNGETYYELASTAWKRSDPEGVTSWFNQQVIDKSPDTINGRQMRRTVRLLKAWAKSRKSWNMPSGFILSILTDETYYKDQTLLDRDDQALLQVMERIRDRLQWSLVVAHPIVIGENVTKTASDANMVELRNRLGDAVSALAVLRRNDCTELDALRALRDLFDTDYFDEKIKELQKEKSRDAGRVSDAGPFITVSGREPQTAVVKKGGEGRYA